MKKRAAHGSSHGGVLLWAIVLLLVLELHPSVSIDQNANIAADRGSVTAASCRNCSWPTCTRAWFNSCSDHSSSCFACTEQLRVVANRLRRFVHINSTQQQTVLSAAVDSIYYSRVCCSTAHLNLQSLVRRCLIWLSSCKNIIHSSWSASTSNDAKHCSLITDAAA